MRLRMTLTLLLVISIAAGGALWATGITQPQSGKSGSSANSQGQRVIPAPPLRTPDVIYIPTPPEVVDAMLRMANVGKGDVLYDLGCGDGRIVIAAAKIYGIHAVGIDIDPQRIKEAKENARTAGVEKLVTFRNEDLFEADIHEATVVTLYLLETLNEKLRPKLLRDLKPGSRIVSHAFRMGDWEPEKTAEVQARHIYFWTVPAKSPKPN